MSSRLLSIFFTRGIAARRIPVPKIVTPSRNCCQPCGPRKVENIMSGPWPVPASRPQPRTGLSVRGIKLNFSVIPLLILSGGEMVAIVIYIYVLATTRPDACYHKDWGFIGDHIDLENAPYFKMWDVEKHNRNLPEVAELYRDMKNSTPVVNDEDDD